LVVLPKIGMNTTEGTLAQWLVAVHWHPSLSEALTEAARRALAP
jgi:hypothetical protein